MFGKFRTIGNPFKPTQREYEASINALNIFFGAVIGVNLGGIEAMPTDDYIFVLIMTAALVTAILFVSYSHRRAWNSVMLIVLLAVTWWIFEYDNGTDITLPDKLLPTLWVWAGMAITTELMPRTPSSDDT